MPITKGDSFRDFDVLQTGMFFDALSGIGGLPLGRMVEFFGEENTGKSTAALQVVAAAQKAGHKCLWVDAEYQYTNEYAEKLGVDTKKLDVLREKLAEDILDQTEDAIREGLYGIVVLDSLGQLSSRIVFEKKSGEKEIGTQASLVKQFVLKTIPHVVMNKILFIGISHERKTIDWGKVYSLGGFTWHAKRKLAFRFKAKAYRKQGEETLGKVIEVTCTKNHVAGRGENTEGKKVDAFLSNASGYDAQADQLDAAIASGKFERVGNTFFFSGEKIGTMKVLREWYKDNAEKVSGTGG